MKGFKYTILFTFGAIYLGFIHPLSAQVKTSVTFSNPWIKQAKKLDQDRKEYKKYLNDSIKQFRQLNKIYKQKLDSMSQAIEDQAEARTGISTDELRRLNRLKKELAEAQFKLDSIEGLDSKEVENLTAIKNSLELKNDSLKSEILKIGSEYDFDILGYQDQMPDSLDLLFSGNDSLLLARRQYMNKQLESYAQGYAGSISGLGTIQQEQQRMMAEQKRLDAYKADFNRYRDKKNLKSSLAKLSKSDLAKKNNTINDAHKTLATYKKKYLTLPSSSNLEGAKKVKSLEGKSFWERIKVGGTLRINQTKYVNVDFAPSVAYQFDKRWSAGTEFVFRGEFGNGNKWYNAFNSKTYGGRIFTDYQVYKSFFAHAEFENLYSQSGQQTERPSTTSVPGAMAGMGKTFRLGKKVDGKVIIQYNFIYDNSNQLYTSPWVIRFGVDWKQLKKSELK